MFEIIYRKNQIPCVRDRRRPAAPNLFFYDQMLYYQIPKLEKRLASSAIIAPAGEKGAQATAEIIAIREAEEEKKRFSSRRDSNPQPPDSKSDALSIAPRERCCASDEKKPSLTPLLVYAQIYFAPKLLISFRKRVRLSFASLFLCCSAVCYLPLHEFPFLDRRVFLLIPSVAVFLCCLSLPSS